jgi:AP-1 complex subunit beta-1
MGGNGAAPATAAPSGANNMEDLMGIFGSGAAPVASPTDDMMNGFGGLNMGGASSQPKPLGEEKKQSNDLLDLL